jgi:hypothetical protein
MYDAHINQYTFFLGERTRNRTGTVYTALMRTRSLLAQRKWTPIALADMFYYHLGSGHGIVLGQKQLQLEYSTLHNIFYKKKNHEQTIFCMTKQKSHDSHQRQLK